MAPKETVEPVIQAIDTSKIDDLLDEIREAPAFSHISPEDKVQFGLLLCARLRFGPFRI